jgi:CMP-N,N'-diacetyllegionaminic acid synthase
MNLAIITARGGSKRLPGKNAVDFMGYPLIYWSIKAALDARCVQKLIVSTDSEELAEIAVRFGAEVPFIRPKYLSDDTAKSEDVLIHALSYYPEARNFILLQPTSPLRSSKHIDDAFDLFMRSNAKGCFSVGPLGHRLTSLFIKNEHDVFSSVCEDVNKTSLSSKDIFSINGALYIHEVISFLDRGAFASDKLVLFEMCKEASVDIDTDYDYQLAKIYFNKINGR